MSKSTNKKVNTKANNTKEEKTMKKSTNKKAKEVKEVVTTEVTAVEEVKTEEVKNEVKQNTVLTIEEVTALYQEAGIKCYNPTAKGNYRIMGFKGGSSLNIIPKKGEYRIYSTADDFKVINEAGLKFDDLTIEEGTNSRDKVRPNTVVCKGVETLKALLAVYATNAVNKIAS